MSTQAVLEAKPRTRTGKGSARATRREGRIPAIVYSNFTEPTSISIDPSALRKTLLESELRFNTVLTLDLEGKSKRTTLLKDWQIDPVSRKLLHADFLEIRLDQKLEAEVPIRLVGTSVGITNGGILSQIRRSVTVRCLPSDIPAILEIDTTKIDVNDSLHVSDVVPPDKVEMVYTINFTLAVCTPPEKEPVSETDDDLETGTLADGETPEDAEGADGEKAEGDEKSDGDSSTKS